MSFQWTREGGSLPQGRSQDNGFGLLLLTSVEEDDSGVYVCTVTAGIYSVQEKLELEVKDDRPDTTTAAAPEYHPRGQEHPRYSSYRDEDPGHYYAHQRPETQQHPGGYSDPRQQHQQQQQQQHQQTADICPGLDVRCCILKQKERDLMSLPQSHPQQTDSGPGRVCGAPVCGHGGGEGCQLRDLHMGEGQGPDGLRHCLGVWAHLEHQPPSGH